MAQSRDLLARYGYEGYTMTGCACQGQWQER